MGWMIEREAQGKEERRKVVRLRMKDTGEEQIGE